jgi:hypothetical protein
MRLSIRSILLAALVVLVPSLGTPKLSLLANFSWGLERVTGQETCARECSQRILCTGGSPSLLESGFMSHSPADFRIIE